MTNLAQPFHTDGGWLWKPPALVGLFCLESADEGGLSRFVSLVTAHEQLRARDPELLTRLYQPFWWDRQAEPRATIRGSAGTPSSRAIAAASVPGTTRTTW